MRWRLHYLLLVCLGLGATVPSEAEARPHSTGTRVARSGKSVHSKGHPSQRRKKKQRHYRPPEMPSGLEFPSFDIVTGQGQLVVVGTKHLPEMRLLVLSDDRGRRFVPDLAECQPPVGVELPVEGSDPALVPANLRWRCTFSVPPLYRRAALVGIAMEWGDKSVEIASQKVIAVYAAAAKAVPSAPKPPKDGVPPPRPQPPVPDDGTEEEVSESADAEVGEGDDDPR